MVQTHHAFLKYVSFKDGDNFKLVFLHLMYCTYNMWRIPIIYM